MRSIASIAPAAAFATMLQQNPQSASAAVGSLPEYGDTNAVLQGLTVRVSDGSQFKNMVDFLRDSFDFKVLREQTTGSVSDAWLGFGPEQLGIPSDFEIPVSSFGMYGGHASLHIRYDSKQADVLFRKGENTSNENIAYVQVGVPTYRISQMVANGGDILDAYGTVNVISPSGLPIRGIVGIRPDPIMLVAIRCQDVKQSRDFYAKLGMVEQPYPFARPANGTGPFEPPQPEKSIYVAPSQNCMGILLLQEKNKKKAIRTNPALSSLNIVYNPSEDGSNTGEPLEVVDPSGVTLAFTSAKVFEEVERRTRV